MQVNVIEVTAGANMQFDYIRRRRICIKGDKIIVLSPSMADLIRRDALLKPYYTASETIKPYLPNGLCHSCQLDKSELSGVLFHFYYISNMISYKQTV